MSLVGGRDFLANERCDVFHLKKGVSPMLRYYIMTTEALKDLRDNQKGVVSFEYVIVAACIVAAVAAAFGTGGAGPIKTALTNAITAIAAKVTAAVS